MQSIRTDERAPSSDARAGRAGHPALALARTLPREVRSNATDPLSDAGALGEWLDAQLEALGEPGPDTALRVVEFRALRETVRELLDAAVEGRSPAPDAVQRVNAVSAAAPSWVRLDASDPDRPAVRRATVSGSRTSQILAAIASSAIELVGGADRERLRRCPAPSCGRPFLTERRGTIWCSPACGNRARVARHHARRRGAMASTGPPDGRVRERA